MAVKNCITTTVYGLCSSADGVIRYVGQTVGDLSRRMAGHRHSAIKRHVTPVSRWIRREMDLGNTIIIFEIESGAVLHRAEIRWIAWYRRHGANLLNLTDGGEGTIGFTHSGRKRPDLSERNRARSGLPGKSNSPECRKKISDALKGRSASWVSERNKVNSPWLGKSHSEETKKKISSALTGRVFTDEWRARISNSKRRKNV